MTLYEISADMRELLELLEDPAADPEVVADTLEGIEGALEDKAEGYIKVMKELEATAKAIKDEEAELRGRRQAVENNINRMKDALTEALKNTGHEDGLNAGAHFLKLVNNGGALPLVIDEERVPEAFKVATYKTNAEAIRTALAEGQAFEWAHFGERGKHLSIK